MDKTHFSTCGKYIVGQEWGSTTLSVRLIPEHLLAGEHSSEDVNLQPPSKYQAVELVRWESRGETQIADRLRNSARDISTLAKATSGRPIGDLRTEMGSGALTMATEMNEEGVQLKVSGGDELSVAKYQISALPSSIPVGSRAEIKLPESPADAIKVILHSNGDMMGSNAAALPLIIERDSRFADQPQQSQLLEDRKVRSRGQHTIKESGEVDDAAGAKDFESTELFWWL